MAFSSALSLLSVGIAAGNQEIDSRLMKKAVFTQKYSCGQLLTCCGFGLVSLCLNNSHAA